MAPFSQVFFLLQKYSDANEVTKSDWLQSIRNLAAFQLFCEGHYDRAFNLFFQLGTEPPQVIGLFPDFLPSNVRSTMTYPSKCPELTGRALEQATSALIEYLKEVCLAMNKQINLLNVISLESSIMGFTYHSFNHLVSVAAKAESGTTSFVERTYGGHHQGFGSNADSRHHFAEMLSCN